MISAIQLTACSGNRWVASYEQSVKIKTENKVFINQKNQNYYYELHGASTYKNQLLGYVIVEDEVDVVSRELGCLVVYCDSHIVSSGIDSLFISIPFESIIKIRAFEYDEGVKHSRTIFLVTVPFILFAIIYSEINSMDLGGGIGI